MAPFESKSRRRLLFVGEAWNGSSARSLRQAMSRLGQIELDDIAEDNYWPRGRGYVTRIASRLLMPAYRRDLSEEIFHRVSNFSPDVVLVYKGKLISAHTVKALRQAGVFTVNVFPDCSPHAHGPMLRDAMGHYDLVVSTKPFHPATWGPIYGYTNRCVCVPHGYDADVHYWSDKPEAADIDVVLAASWRPQYEKLMTDVAQRLSGDSISFALAGPGWAEHKSAFPEHWKFPGPLYGKSYGEFVRRGRIVISPVHSDQFVNGIRQPGDEDTTRTYELAAARTFFLHRRTPFITSVYEEGREGIFWSDADELAREIRYYLARPEEREAVATAAHRRAVPSYSVQERARQVLSHIESAYADEAGGVHA